MFLKISMFKGLIKSAWKGSGLTVGNDGDGIYLMGSYWSIWLARWEMTNKAKAAIIELTGGLPSEGTAYRAWKDQENQYEMTELYDPEMYRPDARKFKIGYKKNRDHHERSKKRLHGIAGYEQLSVFNGRQIYHRHG